MSKIEFFKILSPSQICDKSTYLALWTFWRRNFYFKVSYKLFGVIYDHVPGIWYVRLTLLIVSEKKSEPYDAPIRIYGRKSVQSMIFEKSSLKMKNLIVQIMLIRADFEWKLFSNATKKFYTSYDHNQGIHKVCLTSLIMSVKN